jgi:DNA-binding ferritin-like protein (Dps family)
MPSCKNGKGSYKGTEPSPKGRGFCAKHEKIGTKKRGRDKKMWVVRSVKLSTGKRCKRWFKVLPKPKLKTKPIKRKASKVTKKKKKKKTTKRKKLRGGMDDYEEQKQDAEQKQNAVIEKLKMYANSQINGESVQDAIMDLHNVIENYEMLVVLPRELEIDTSKFQAKVQDAQQKYNSAMDTFEQDIHNSQLTDWQKHDILDIILPEFEDSIVALLNVEIEMIKNTGQTVQTYYNSKFSQ